MKSCADDKDDTFVIQFYTPEAAQDGAKLYVGQSMMIKSFCVRIYLNKVSGLQYPFFASVPNQGQFNLLFSFDVGYGFVSLNGRQIMFEIIDKHKGLKADFLNKKKHNLTVSWNNTLT